MQQEQRQNQVTSLGELLSPQTPTTVQSYNRVDEIELTEEEAEEILRAARKEKARKKNEADYWARVNAPVEYKPVTAQELSDAVLEYAEKTIPRFIIDERIADIWTQLSFYFARDKNFKGDLNKGLLFRGPVGTGKTTLLRLFQRNSTNDYYIKSAREVADEYTRSKEGGAQTLDQYSTLFDVYPKEHYGQKHIGCCFDDLGTERAKKHFGNESNVMEEIILNRYDRGLIGKTHFSTNLTTEQIEEVYGSRVRSRLREMCNVFEFIGTDRRK